MTAIYLPIFYIPPLSLSISMRRLHPTVLIFFTALLLQTTQNVLEQWGNFFGDLKCLDVIEDVI